eukprot:4095801-Alexandrium_andersonii.AAC.1
MSASLVGSEMCIRDRRLPLRCPEALFSAFDRGKRFWEQAFTQGRKMRPVSYTHLTLPTICSV